MKDKQQTRHHTNAVEPSGGCKRFPKDWAMAVLKTCLVLVAALGLISLEGVNCAAQETANPSNPPAAPSSSSSAATATGSAAAPVLPKRTVDLTLPTQTGTNRTVSAGDSRGFQNAIDQATCGDVIVLAAGSTYSGNFVIPATSCSGWIEITSSALTVLPQSGN